MTLSRHSIPPSACSASPRLGDSAAAATQPSPADESSCFAENDTGMEMMHDMAVEPTGDIDRDFVAMKGPHYQGAIDMAQILLRYGRNEQFKRMAQEIIVTQQQEIAAMRLAIGEPPQSTTTSLALPSAAGPVISYCRTTVCRSACG